MSRESPAFLATVAVELRGAGPLQRGRVADAFMAVPDVVTVKVPGDGTAEYRVDVWAPTPELAGRRAAAVADEVGRTIRRDVRLVRMKLETEAERLAALQTAAGYGPLGFTGRARAVA